jgi:hypothetical protein
MDLIVEIKELRCNQLSHIGDVFKQRVSTQHLSGHFHRLHSHQLKPLDKPLG